MNCWITMAREKKTKWTWIQRKRATNEKNGKKEREREKKWTDSHKWNRSENRKTKSSEIKAKSIHLFFFVWFDVTKIYGNAFRDIL